MSSEVWFRNPKLYIRECIELGVSRVAWDRGFLVKNRVDPLRFGDLYFPSAVDYRMLLVGDQGTAEVRRGRDVDDPVAVYPTWVYGEDDMSRLENWLANPIGEDAAACADKRFPADERPVLGQEHRVVITGVPTAVLSISRHFYGLLADLQEDYPDAIIHVHNLYGYGAMFARRFGAVDTDPRTLAKKGKVTLPNGKEVTYENAAKTPQWVEVVGFRPSDLSVPRNRCMFNMRSSQWAAAHFRENVKFRVRGAAEPDKPGPATTNGVKSKTAIATVGDKFICDTCSLANTCKYFRDGSVCSLPDSDPAKLARFFKTRNSDSIIDGLGALMEQQVDRLEMGRRLEEEYGELSPEVTKIIDGLFDKGVNLAKLLNPALRGGLKVVVPVQTNGNGQVAVRSGTPQELAAQAVAALEQRGYTRDEMTAELIEAVMSGQVVPPKALALGPGDDDNG